MEHRIVDTNVLIKANEVIQGNYDRCSTSSSKALIHFINNDKVYIDNLGLILDEYFHQCNRSGQPGLGDAFAKWIFDNQWHSNRIKRVEIHPIGIDENIISFEEFPNNPSLECFDKSDRKFVAVCVAELKIPKIINAVDSDWIIHDDIFKDEGIEIIFLC